MSGHLPPAWLRADRTQPCVMAGCQLRATSTTVVRMGGQEREVHVCGTHASRAQDRA